MQQKTDFKNHGFTVKLLFYSGIYYDSDRKHPPKILHWIYGLTLLTLMLIVLILFIMKLVTSIGDMNTIVNVLFVIVTSLLICYKSCLLIWKREKVHEFLHTLNDGYFKLRDEDEYNNIYKKWDFMFTILAMVFLVFAINMVLAMLFAPLALPPETRPLPAEIWTPHEIDQSNYWFWFWGILVSYIASGITTVGMDPFIFWLLWQINIQYELILHRLNKLPNILRSSDISRLKPTELYNREKQRLENLELNQVIEHQLAIYKYAEEMNSFFAVTFAAHYSVTGVTLCFTMYKYFFLERGTWFHTGSILVYFLGITIQFFFFCFICNEIMTKSEDFTTNLYEFDWLILTNSSMKKLLVILIFSNSNPIILKGGPIFILTLVSFSQILKTTYSVFNVLQNV